MVNQTEELINRLDPNKNKCKLCKKWHFCKCSIGQWNTPFCNICVTKVSDKIRLKLFDTEDGYDEKRKCSYFFITIDKKHTMKIYDFNNPKNTFVEFWS